MIKEAIDWSIGWIIDDFGSKKVNYRDDEKWPATSLYDLEDKEIGQIIGTGWEKTVAPSGNTLWSNNYNEITTLRKRFREKIGVKPGINK